MTLLLLKSTQALLASGETQGLWEFLYLLGCKHFIGKQLRGIWFAFCTALRTPMCQKRSPGFSLGGEYIYMCICMYVCVRYMSRRTDIASPTLLARMMGRGCAWSKGCLWCGIAVSCLVWVLPYLLSFSSFSSCSFFFLFLFLFLSLSSPSPFSFSHSPFLILLFSISFSICLPFPFLFPLSFSISSPRPPPVPAPCGAPGPAAGTVPAGGWGRAGRERRWRGSRRPCPPFPSSETSRQIPPPHPSATDCNYFLSRRRSLARSLEAAAVCV